MSSIQTNAKEHDTIAAVESLNLIAASADIIHPKMMLSLLIFPNVVILFSFSG